MPSRASYVAITLVAAATGLTAFRDASPVGTGHQATTAAQVQVQRPPGQPSRGAAPPSGARTALALGRVIDGDTGRPVSGVTITLGGSAGRGAPSGASPPGGLSDQPARVITDGEGRFLFRDLTAGSYSLTTTKGGYLPGGFGRTTFREPPRQLVLEEHERRADIEIKIWRTAAISGMVADEGGEPAVAATVTLLQRVTVRGQTQTAIVNSAATDDRGMFRLSGLAPGSYFLLIPSVAVTSPKTTIASLEGPMAQPERQAIMRSLQESSGMTPSGVGQPYGDNVLQNTLGFGLVAPAAVEGARLMVYRSIYYPDETSIATATPIAVTSGQEMEGVRLQLRLVPTVSVSGVLIGPEGPVPHMGMRLVPSGGAEPSFPGMTGLETAATVSDSTGRFTLLGVPEGQYLIRVLRIPRPAPPPPPPPPPPPGLMPPGAVRGAVPTALPVEHSVAYEAPAALSANQPISVGPDDLRDVTVVLVAGGRLRGRFEFEGAGPRPTSEQLQRLSVTLQPVGSTPGGNQSLPTVVDARGQFVTSSYPAGRYIASAGAPASWNLKSIQVAGRDASEAAFDLGSSDIDSVIVTYTDQRTELVGSVARGQAGSAERIMVVAFPADYVRWAEDGMSNRRIRTVEVRPDSGFVVLGLAAGDYLVTATVENVPNTGPDATFLAELAKRATPVSVRLGGRTSIVVSQVHGR